MRRVGRLTSGQKNCAAAYRCPALSKTGAVK